MRFTLFPTKTRGNARELFLGALMLVASSQRALAQAPAPASEPAPAPSSSPLAPEPAQPPAPAVGSSPAPVSDPGSQPQPAPAAPSSPAKEEAPPKVSIAAGKGMTIASGDGRTSMTVRARIQLRDTFQHDAATGQNTNDAQVRTLRLYVQGNVLSPDLKYLIQLAFGANDFDANNPSPIFDAFVEWVKWRDLNVRVGQYFVPFDRARTIREFALQFVDRQQVVRELTLDRDMGVMFSSQDLAGLGSRLGYHLYVGTGDGRNRFADPKNPYGPQVPSVLMVGRLVIKPFGAFEDYDQEADISRSPKPRLGIGLAGGYNISSDRQRSTYGNTYTLGTFNYAHAAADLFFKWHGFSLLTEYVRRDANKSTNSALVDGELVTEFSRSGWGYFIQAGQMLTDKLEVVARWDDLHAEAGTDPELRAEVQRIGRQVGGGLNLYLNGHFFKVQSDYFCIFNRVTDEPIHVLRAQLDATF